MKNRAFMFLSAKCGVSWLYFFPHFFGPVNFTVHLQEQKLNKLVIDTSNAKDFERPLKFNSKSNELIEQSPFSNQAGDPKPSVSDSAPNSFKSNSSSEEM